MLVHSRLHWRFRIRWRGEFYPQSSEALECWRRDIQMKMRKIHRAKRERRDQYGWGTHWYKNLRSRSTNYHEKVFCDVRVTIVHYQYHSDEKITSLESKGKSNRCIVINTALFLNLTWQGFFYGLWIKPTCLRENCLFFWFASEHCLHRQCNFDMTQVTSRSNENDIFLSCNSDGQNKKFISSTGHHLQNVHKMK